MKVLLRRFARENAFILGLLASSAFIVYLVLNLVQSTSNIQKLTTAKAGLHTCFTRLQQTYTGFMLNNQSGYLSKKFRSQTESCLGDFNAHMASLAFLDSKQLNMANSLGIEAHWFHKKIDQWAKKSSGLTTEKSKLKFNISFKYSSLESSHDKLGSLIREKIKQNETLISWHQGVLALCIGMSLLCVFWLVRNSRKNNRIWALEKKAGPEMLNGDYLNIALTCDLLKQYLYELGSPIFLQLFDKYNASLMSLSVNDGPSKRQKSLDLGEFRQVTEEVHVEGENIDRQVESISFGPVINRVLNLFSSKIVNNKISLDLNLPEKVKVAGKEDTFEVALYNILSYTLKVCKNNNSGRLAIKHQIDDKSLFLTFEVPTLRPNHINIQKENEIKVCSELLNGLGGEITTSNVIKNAEMALVIKLSLPLSTEQEVEENVDLSTSHQQAPQL